MNKNPHGFAQVRQRNESTGEDSGRRFPIAYFYNSTEGLLEAEFSGIYINELADGYSYQFLAWSSEDRATSN